VTPINFLCNGRLRSWYIVFIFIFVYLFTWNILVHILSLKGNVLKIKLIFFYLIGVNDIYYGWLIFYTEAHKLVILIIRVLLKHNIFGLCIKIMNWIVNIFYLNKIWYWIIIIFIFLILKNKFIMINHTN